MSESEILVDKGPPAPEPKSRRKLWLVLGIAGAVVAIAATVGFFVLRERSKPSPKALPPAQTVSDPVFGWAISFPKSWQRFDERNTQSLRLTAAGGEGDSFAGLQVFVNALREEINPKDLPDIKDERIENLKRNTPGLEITSARVIKLNRLPAIHVVYTFPELEGLPLLHSHYYIFNGAKLEQIIFETSPQDFSKYSKTFDAIAATFRSTPRRLSPAPPSPSP